MVLRENPLCGTTHIDLPTSCVGSESTHRRIDQTTRIQGQGRDYWYLPLLLLHPATSNYCHDANDKRQMNNSNNNDDEEEEDFPSLDEGTSRRNPAKACSFRGATD
jgi:hypothetical protein